MSVTDALGKASAVMFADGQIQLLNLVGSLTLAADLVLTDAYRNVLLIDPAAARNIDLPPEQHGLWFLIFNKANAAETITVRADTAGATVVALAQDEAALVWSDGTAWYYGQFTAPL